MARGGRRKGAPATTYKNRSDLTAGDNKQPVRVANDLPYGERQAREQSQRAVPLPQVTGIAAPSARPAEPITAGLPVGAGPGPEVLGPQATALDPADELRAILQAFPNDDLAELVNGLGRGQTLAGVRLRPGLSNVSQGHGQSDHVFVMRPARGDEREARRSPFMATQDQPAPPANPGAS